MVRHPSHRDWLTIGDPTKSVWADGKSGRLIEVPEATAIGKA